ncbi:MAG: hypothetical protein M1834_009174 [Cirrosporium novae-zelandiae]|nr:MAG: hypothetical protein M1834_009174 [Cirrosporium novae-zelandiae]
MAPFPITVLKFVGTTSLGLLTGLSYNLHSTLLPTILAFPNATTASRFLAQLHLRTLHSTAFLTPISIITFPLAFFLSARRGRHPYLLWVSLISAIGAVTDLFVYGQEDKQMVRKLGFKGHGYGGKKGKEPMMAPMEESDEDINGETVRMGVENWRRRESVRGTFAGVAWGLAMLGLWGDGF